MMCTISACVHHVPMSDDCLMCRRLLAAMAQTPWVLAVMAA
jgi:hypothetical protein